MERVKLDGTSLEYEVAGTGEPAVFIHGSFIADTFLPLVGELGRTGRYKLIAYHRRGYVGSSRVSGPVSIARQAADCRGLLRHLGVERAHVVGHSFGGAVALELALGEPDVAHSLALLEPALAVGASAEGYREALARAVQRYRKAGAAVMLEEFMQARWPGYRSPLEQMLPGAFAQAVDDAGAFEHEVSGLVDWHFGESEAHRITQPTLAVLGGDSEALWSRFGETYQLLLAWIVRAEGVVVPGATHFPQLQDARGMADALVAFWARHPIAAESL